MNIRINIIYIKQIPPPPKKKKMIKKALSEYKYRF